VHVTHSFTGICEDEIVKGSQVEEYREGKIIYRVTFLQLV